MALKKIGCDLGNFGVKVVCEGMDPFTFESRCEDYDDNKYIMGGVDVLSFDNQQLILGSGDFDYETIKVRRSNLRECLAGALAQCTDDKDEVIVGVGLPAEQYMEDRETMKELLTFAGDRITFSYGPAGQVKEKTVYIKDVIVQPESLAAYWAMEHELLKRRASEIIIVDIGGRTTDVCTIRRNLDGSVLPTSARTEILGTLKAYEAMAAHFSKLAQERKIEYKFSTEIIESYVEKGYDLGERFEFIDKVGYTTQAYKAVANKIARFVKKANDDYGKALIVITGGGGVKMGEYVQAHFPDNSIIVDDIYCNAKGYLVGINNVYRTASQSKANA